MNVGANLPRVKRVGPEGGAMRRTRDAKYPHCLASRPILRHQREPSQVRGLGRYLALVDDE